MQVKEEHKEIQYINPSHFSLLNVESHRNPLSLSFASSSRTEKQKKSKSKQVSKANGMHSGYHESNVCGVLFFGSPLGGGGGRCSCFVFGFGLVSPRFAVQSSPIRLANPERHDGGGGSCWRVGELEVRRRGCCLVL